MSQATMTDVAKAAGVSLATVGRVLHGGYISQEKKERVEKAIKELGYVPNMAASGLKSSKSRLIGHLMLFNPNQLYEKIARGIEQSAMKRGYSVLALTRYQPEEEERLLQEFMSRGVDGVIITSNNTIQKERVQELTSRGIPVVMVERSIGGSGVDSVLINDEGGACEAVDSLIKRGRKNIAFVGPVSLVYDTAESCFSVERARFRGYQKALERQGMRMEERYVARTGGYRSEDGYHAAETLYGKEPLETETYPDGVFCASDILAAGVMQYLYEKKLRVPEDVSIVGYDDTISSFLSPKISSVALDTEAIGEQTIELLLSRKEEPTLEERSVYIDTILMERNS